ncbi:hypothetical protein ESZ50_04700 [Weissella muntiaci]|uniref:Uncharacterized protein n=1 Tax=Weissella muntiaci TaxID=2508881 RepID=A0A6C2C7L3_9LACO|nr:hypothetical protein [Weissella muntiaci]TYC49894.1 hypothetical protein ESZ50_04700 [Weissella muntiaci]
MRPTNFLASLLTRSQGDIEFSNRFDEDYQYDFPIMMGLATREDMEYMSIDDIAYLNYKANALYKIQHPEVEWEN